MAAVALTLQIGNSDSSSVFSASRSPRGGVFGSSRVDILQDQSQTRQVLQLALLLSSVPHFLSSATSFSRRSGSSPPPAIMLHESPVISDILATAVSGGIVLSLLRLFEEAAKRGLFDQKLNRKLVHISIGLVFMLSWPLFSSGHRGATLASLVVGINIFHVLLVGLDIWKHEASVKSMSRYGDSRELLKGPLYYATTITLACAVYWRSSPIAIAVVCNLCAGDEKKMENNAPRRNQLLPPLPPLMSANGPLNGNSDRSEEEEKQLQRKREYSRRFRAKEKKNMIMQESEVKFLQTEIATNIRRLKLVGRQNWLLKMENESLNQKISIVSKELLSKRELYEEMKTEMDILKHINGMQQQQSNFENNSKATTNFGEVNIELQPESTVSGGCMYK